MDHVRGAHGEGDLPLQRHLRRFSPALDRSIGDELQAGRLLGITRVALHVRVGITDDDRDAGGDGRRSEGEAR